MNSNIRVSRLAALALCGTALAACDSIKDVREGPAYAIPPEKVAVSGTITGVGVSTTRPVEIQMVVRNDKPYEEDDDDETDDGNVIGPDGTRTTYYSVRGTRALKFGSLDIGATYEISVTRQPFGRVCTPTQNASGTVTGPITDIEIECVRDGTALYQVTANIANAVANDPPEGFKLTLTTEEGTEEVVPAPGQTSVTFDLPVLYPDANPPPFAYSVRATNTENGTANNCVVANGSGELGAGSGNITNVTVTGCQFVISAVASYSAPTGGAPQVMGVGGLTLGLKDLAGDIVAETDPIMAFSPVPVAFPGTWVSNADALYEVTVVDHPDGQFCTVDNGGLASLIAGANVTSQVRCRNIPAVANQLEGTYRVVREPEEATEENPRPLGTAEDRHFMTFFDNGSFLFGVHNSTTAAGVEHGFYNFNPAAGTIEFTVFTDSSGFGGTASCTFNFATNASTCGTGAAFGAPGANPPVSANTGLSGAAGYLLPFTAFTDVLVYGPPGTVTATNVTMEDALPAVPPAQPGEEGLPPVGKQISLTFGTQSATNPNPTWTLVEVVSTPGEMEGAWVSPDSRRVWVYDETTLFGWHAGVNGAPNLQDACYPIENRPTDFGYSMFYSLRVSGCSPGGVSWIDIPYSASTPAIVPGFAGRIPGSISLRNATVLPSPIWFKVTPGTAGEPDTLTIQNSLNSVLVGDPITFVRHSSE